MGVCTATPDDSASNGLAEAITRLPTHTCLDREFTCLSGLNRSRAMQSARYAILPATMSRQLRSRASRPDYAALFQYDDPENEDAGPSKPPVPQDEVDSGSDFAPEGVQDEAAEAEDDVMDEDADAEEDVPTQGPSRASSVVIVTKPAAPRIETPKAKPMPGLSSKPKNYVLPNANHRHRLIPLFDRPGPVERLIGPPSPFGTPRISSTNSWSVNQAVLERISKAWGFNVGQGGLWDLLEDRAWFKESMASNGEESADERARRPRVHANVRAAGFEVIDMQCVPPTFSCTCTMSYCPSQGMHLHTFRRTCPQRSRERLSLRLLLYVRSDHTANRRVLR